MSDKESDALLERLWQLCERRELTSTSTSGGSAIVMWDNRCTQHARTDFPAAERRLLSRVGIEGDKPY